MRNVRSVGAGVRCALCTMCRVQLKGCARWTAGNSRSAHNMHFAKCAGCTLRNVHRAQNTVCQLRMPCAQRMVAACVVCKVCTVQCTACAVCSVRSAWWIVCSVPFPPILVRTCFNEKLGVSGGQPNLHFMDIAVPPGIFLS